MQLWPRRLYAQLILLVACILLATGTMSAWLSGRQQSTRLMTVMRENAVSMTKSIGESCAHYLVLREYAGLESLLLGALEMQHILRLQVVEPDGFVVGDVENGPTRASRLLQGESNIAPPAKPLGSSNIKGGQLIVWQPIAAGTSLGWIKATYDLSSIHAAAAETWKNTLLLSLFWVGGAAGLLLLVLRPLVRDIGSLSAFARRLDQYKGDSIRVGRHTREITELASALNNASRRIFESERQLIEDRERLRTSYDYIQQLISAANVMIVGLDAAGQVRLFNKAAETITGYGHEELSGVSWFETILPRDRYPEVWREVKTIRWTSGGMPTEFEYPILTHGGEERFIAWKNSRIQAGQEIATISFGIDITERVRAEEALLLSNERFALAADAAGLGVWDWDIRQNLLVWDKQMYALYGIRQEEVIGAYEAWLQGVHPDDRAHCNEVSEQARLGKRKYDTEFRVVWTDGSIHHLKAYGKVVRAEDGTPIRMTGINFDVTARKQAEEALHQLNLQLDQRVRERTVELEIKNVELEKLNRLFVGRELRMVELKEKIKELEGGR